MEKTDKQRKNRQTNRHKERQTHRLQRKYGKKDKITKSKRTEK